MSDQVWNLCHETELPGGERLVIRSLQRGDAHILHAFREELSALSRDLFRPYPWDDGARLADAFQLAIETSIRRVDASFLMFIGDRPISHFFLWKAGGNPHSLQYGINVPELGVAVSDAFHGRGVGILAVCILKGVAKELGCDAIELTTARDNKAGWRTYLKSGFEFLGMIRNPLETDATEVTMGHLQATAYREERQMVCILNETKREAVLEYLARKRT